MDSDNEDDKNLMNTVWYSVNEIVKQEARLLGKQVSEAFVTSLTEIVYNQMQIMATDLEAFAVHGKRSVISMEDVKLCARRNESLYQLITETAKEITEDNKRKKK